MNSDSYSCHLGPDVEIKMDCHSSITYHENQENKKNNEDENCQSINCCTLFIPEVYGVIINVPSYLVENIDELSLAIFNYNSDLFRPPIV